MNIYKMILGKSSDGGIYKTYEANNIYELVKHVVEVNGINPNEIIEIEFVTVVR